MPTLETVLKRLGFRPQTIELVMEDVSHLSEQAQVDVTTTLAIVLAWRPKAELVRAWLFGELATGKRLRKSEILPRVRRETSSGRTTLERVLSEMRRYGFIRVVGPKEKDARGRFLPGQAWYIERMERP